MKRPIFRRVLTMLMIASGAHMGIMTPWSGAEEQALEKEAGKYCKVNVVQMIGQKAYNTVLEICPDGIVFRNDIMKEARTISWSDVARWQFIGSKAGADDLTEAHSILRIIEKEGTAHARGELFFVICCTVSAGQKVYETMKSYDPSGQY